MPWLLRRTLDAVLMTLLGVAVLFVLVRAMPGDPLTAILGERSVDPATTVALRARFGLDTPLPTALAAFLRDAVRGDLGLSIATQRPVTALLGERLGPTLLLGALTLLVNFGVGVALGLWGALHPTTRRARLLSTVTVVGYALPTFVVGVLLVWLGAVHLGWFPAGGLADPLLAADADTVTVLRDRLRHLALPLATMVLATIAVPLAQQRSAALETARAPWVRAARARGVAPARVAWRHVWRPALSPVITLLGLWLPMLVGGAVFVEAVFAWPGVGSLLATATAQRDLPVVIGGGALIIALVQAGGLLTDCAHRATDPRRRRDP
ncbi:MAG TPA: ABC transporter permease [Gemmatimonadales bacterium]|nr:ABC transporter permease [Gemmatimonadales bacterium]